MTEREFFQSYLQHNLEFATVRSPPVRPEVLRYSRKENSQ